MFDVSCALGDCPGEIPQEKSHECVSSGLDRVVGMGVLRGYTGVCLCAIVVESQANRRHSLTDCAGLEQFLHNPAVKRRYRVEAQPGHSTGIIHIEACWEFTHLLS